MLILQMLPMDYSLSFPAKFILEKILIKAIPMKNMVKERLFSIEILAALKSKNPATKLNKAHKIFIKGDESPLPGGFANGVGKEFPQMPLTKCGTKLARTNPAKKALK